MGIEYQISCPSESLPKLEEFLRRVGRLPSAQFPEQIEFRFPPSTPDEKPDATAVVESQGLYFCVFSGSERVAVLFRRIIDEALSLSGSSGSIVVTSL
jgi:hypothetical protein